MEKCDEVIIHETFQHFIRPEEGKSFRSLKVSEFITKSLIDYCSREFMSTNGINTTYSSDYAKNVIFIREALKNVPSEAERKRLIFSGSIDEFIEKTTTPDFDCLTEAENNMKFESDYDRMLDSVGDALGTKGGISEYDISDKEELETKKQLSDLEKNLNEISTNSENVETALNNINDAASQFLSEEDALAVKNITDKYFKNNNSLNSSNNVSKETNQPKFMVHFARKDLQRKQNKSETVNPPENIQELYKEISKIYMKNKAKSLSLNQEHNIGNAGYTSSLILYILVSFISGAIFTILYMMFR